VVLNISSRLAELADHYNAERRVVLDNGDIVAELRLGSTAIITPLVARHGGEVTVLEPASLAAAAREWVEAALEVYSENSKLDGLDS
jgi:proteasome accessory factor C